MEKFVVHPDYTAHKADLLQLIRTFDTSGRFVPGIFRNKIKIFKTNGEEYNIKAFKKPHCINAFAYRYLRPGKAKRSYENALKLLSLDIGTPKPVGYLVCYSLLGIQKSYYISEHLNYDFTYREIIEDKQLTDKKAILQAYTQFIYKVHEAGILFKDNSPGNTLIKKTDTGDYAFYLVDLNRMVFKPKLTKTERLRNLERLSPLKSMYEVMGETYAQLYGTEIATTQKELWAYADAFQKKYHRKQRFKQKLKGK
ncbi:MAG: lipopolysaccharide kinase InaA family protein [Flavobacteriaceae bacterium]|nr:lipopolysaccharide kinase InaA family protein [Flavobacteriaceae bacterium]